MKSTQDLPAQAPRSRTRPAVPFGFDVRRLRHEFPALAQSVSRKPLVYLDNAATTQKPRAVIEATSHYYEVDNANVHRGVHELGDRSTALYERSRARVQRFLNAASPQEIVFVRGTTEAINLVAQSFGRRQVGAGDEVVVTAMEHHANIVPWQMLCREQGAALRVVPITDAGDLRLDDYETVLTPCTKLVALTHVSNALGTINPVERMIAMAHDRGIPVLLDGAQAVSHLAVDVQALDCDFYAFSGHKVYGPMGIGVLYGKARHLEVMPPWQGGGDMIRTVSFEETTYNVPPYRFEAGTPNVAGAVGLATALEELDRIGRDAIAEHESRLLSAAVERLRTIPGVRLVGEPARRAGVISFVVDDPPMSALDVGARLNLEGIAVRTGHHCCQPLMQRLGIPGTVRASFAMYNTMAEVDALATALHGLVAAERSARRANAAALASASGPADGELAYPRAAAASVFEAAEALLEEFEELGDWSERYELLIEMGRKLPALPDALKTEANRVRGCQSTVFLHARVRPGTVDVVEFLAESDSEIVRGLLALLQRALSGQRAGAILDFDLPGLFARLGLQTNLTMGRRNGLKAMIERLRVFVAGVARPEPVAPAGGRRVAG